MKNNNDSNAGCKQDDGVYLTITVNWELQVCKIRDLKDYVLEGDIVGGKLNTLGAVAFADYMKAIIEQYSCRFVVVQLDPFYLRIEHMTHLSVLSIPMGAIVCDTHHGYKPLSRLIKLFGVAPFTAVLLQFNQRHELLFRLIGIDVYSSFFSPDMYRYINMGKIKGLIKSNGKLEIVDRVRSDIKDKGVFIGNLSPHHKYRIKLLKLLQEEGLEFDVLVTRNACDMINVTSKYKWALNLPLNGDFNRRFLESMLADVPILSEKIPSSQFLHEPFKMTQKHIFSFERPEGAMGISANVKNLNKSRPQETIATIYNSGYERQVLEKFCDSIENNRLLGKKRGIKQISDAFIYCTAYEELLALSLDPSSYSMQEIDSLVYKNRQLVSELYDIGDEFHRLGL